MGEGFDANDLLAAERGDLVAMDVVGLSLFRQGDVDEAEMWLTKAATQGSESAMIHLGILLSKKGDIKGAERWLRVPAASGDPDAMYSLAYLLRDRDPDEAETWSRRSAEAGQVDAMFGLGSLLLGKGDLTGAEQWFHRAVDEGSDRAMERLGKVLEELGDPEGAAGWYLRAVDTGDTDAMMALGKMSQGRGDLAEATAWYRRAAEAGSHWGEYLYGYLLSEQGEDTDAEAQFRLAVKGDIVPAMDMLGYCLESRGEFDEALDWYLQAAKAGSSFAADALPVLRERIKADGMLDSIGFDTFGWERFNDANGVRQWRSSEGGLVEHYFDFPPDLESLDPDDLRREAMELQGFVESPTFRREDLPDAVQQYLPTELPEQVSLLDVHVFPVSTAQCVQMTSRHRAHGEVHYAMTTMVMFAECFWVLGIELNEGEVVGEREGAVARKVLEEGPATTLLEFDPYDRKWDGMIPIEDDPLTRLRVLTQQLRDSITLGENLSGLDPFVPIDE